MKNAYTLIQFHQQNKRGSYSSNQSWENDFLENYSAPTASLLMHAYLLANEQELAFKLAQEGSPLGWGSTENVQPLFITYCFVKMVGQPINKLPIPIKKLFIDALSKSKETWLYDETHQNLLKNLEDAYEELFSTSHIISNNIIEWCLQAAEERVNGIVSNQHRNAYDKAALLTIACTVTLKHINPDEATKFFNRIKNKYPRHSAFQAQLKQHCAQLATEVTH
jgi:paraquat-inducible protein B